MANQVRIHNTTNTTPKTTNTTEKSNSKKTIAPLEKK
jgi:hypothetical protein